MKRNGIAQLVGALVATLGLAGTGSFTAASLRRNPVNVRGSRAVSAEGLVTG
jgi:hypothetical protein